MSDLYKPYQEEVSCVCCGGTGSQTNKEGLRVICPACRGSGKMKNPKPRLPSYHPKFQSKQRVQK